MVIEPGDDSDWNGPSIVPDTSPHVSCTDTLTLLVTPALTCSDGKRG